MSVSGLSHSTSTVAVSVSLLVFASVLAAWHCDPQAGLGNFLSRIDFSALQTSIHAKTLEAKHDTQAEAKQLEQSIYDHATSLEDYQEQCRQAALIIESTDRPPSACVPDAQSDVSLPPSATTIGKYTDALLHRNGIFSEVYKASTSRFPSNSVLEPGNVALKVTTPSTMIAPHNSEREAFILQSLHQHSNVIRLVETFTLPGGQFVLVFPFMPFSLDLLLAEQVMTEHQAICHVRDMFAALAFVHAHGVIHRDVKPSNVLLRSINGPAFLSDFGISWSTQCLLSELEAEKVTDVGTSSYRPPEILFGQKDYDQSLDLWAAGCVVAEVTGLSSSTLFESGSIGTELALIQSIFTTLGTPDDNTWPNANRCPDWGKIQWKNYPRRSWQDILPRTSPNARDLVSMLVQYEPARRLSASAACQHHLFAGVWSHKRSDQA